MVHQTYSLQSDTYQISQLNFQPHSVLRLWPYSDDFASQVLNRLKYSGVDVFSQITLASGLIEIALHFIDFEKGQTLLQSWLSQQSTHFSIQTFEKAWVKPRMLIFDMDSTLIQMECIDELARKNNQYEMVAKVTESAMNGEIDFKESLAQRVAALKGLPVSVMNDLCDSLVITLGVPEISDWAKKNNIQLIIASGGFTPMAEALKRRFEFDKIYANKLEVRNDYLTGNTLGTIIDAKAKELALVEMREFYQLSKDEVWAIGDGANDLLMLNAAGLGFAFDAKESVRLQSNAVIFNNDLKPLIAWLDSIY